jgi:hypothetical protein
MLNHCLKLYQTYLLQYLFDLNYAFCDVLCAGRLHGRHYFIATRLVSQHVLST